jgi:hypothetical protein
MDLSMHPCATSLRHASGQPPTCSRKPKDFGQPADRLVIFVGGKVKVEFGNEGMASGGDAHDSDASESNSAGESARHGTCDAWAGVWHDMKHERSGQAKARLPARQA